jgi:hypothetical protein
MTIWKTYFRRFWEKNEKILIGTKKQFESVYGKGWNDAIVLLKEGGLIKDAPESAVTSTNKQSTLLMPEGIYKLKDGLLTKLGEW